MSSVHLASNPKPDFSSLNELVKVGFSWNRLVFGAFQGSNPTFILLFSVLKSGKCSQLVRILQKPDFKASFLAVKVGFWVEAQIFSPFIILVEISRFLQQHERIHYFMSSFCPCAPACCAFSIALNSSIASLGETIRTLPAN